MEELDSCMLCPRECGVNRSAGKTGYCGYDAGYHIASVFIHHGEEPVIGGTRGICNIFFKGCNLRCTYCQNYQISRGKGTGSPLSLNEVLEKVAVCLDQGVEAVGFVSPSHFTPHVKKIIHELKKLGYSPIIVYNTNGYDKTEVIKSFEGIIDVYLPDLKYMDPSLSGLYSDTPDYPGIAKEALKEMYRQKGNTVVLNDDGQVVTGLILRHMVLPDQTKDSIKVMEWIASNLSPSVHISLMSQYYPTVNVACDPVLGRTITSGEYCEVLEAMERMGFYNGWIQNPDSSMNYRPDFDKETPFKT